jgi:hypothetical protein
VYGVNVKGAFVLIACGSRGILPPLDAIGRLDLTAAGSVEVPALFVVEEQAAIAVAKSTATNRRHVVPQRLDFNKVITHLFCRAQLRGRAAFVRRFVTAYPPLIR